ncbi:hypothetical protein, partial [Paenibacillus polymyxa]
FQRSNSFSLRFSAAIRSYHVHFKNARVILFFFYENHFTLIILFFETAVLLSAQIIYHFALLITTGKLCNVSISVYSYGVLGHLDRSPDPI